VNLLKSEFRKLFYSRTTYGLILGATALAVLAAGVSPYAMSKARIFGNALASQQMVDAVYGKATGGYLFAMILGVILMAGEFRQGTAVATFLASPKRLHVALAKVLVAFVAGALLQAVATGAGMAMAHFSLGLYKNVAAPSSTVFLDTSLAALISGSVLAVVGVAIGTLLRNQMFGTLAAILWLNLVEPILLLVFPDGAKWFATGLIGGILDLHISTGNRLVHVTTSYFDPITASLLLLGYGAVFVAVAVASTLRRDVD
jgi:ABC-type transport system involved in multi-copper enzyme maturation permease subunit